MKNILVGSCLFLYSFSILASPEVVYGDDNRLDYFEVADERLKEVSRSTAVMIHNLFMRNSGKEFYFRNVSLQDRGICPTEKFSEQNTVGMCSGFLVAPNLIMTAGHCMNADFCKNYRWVFDYKTTKSGQTRITVPTRNVYSCKKIRMQKYNAETPAEDYALIELNKPVKDRTFLKIAPRDSIVPGTELTLMGYPSGLPLKIASGAKVRSLDQFWFMANTDSFQGNSGSAVVNTKTGEVAGILVRGEIDYNDDAAKGCKTVRVCPEDGCMGESVSYPPQIPNKER